MLPRLLEKLRASKRARTWGRRGVALARRWPRLDYWLRTFRERLTYNDVKQVHDLPPIFHYWSDTYLRPKCEAFGFSGPDDFFVKHLEESFRAAPNPSYRVISIGAGNCDTEIRLAATLRACGIDGFVIECLDLNPTMLERGRAAAARQDLARHIIPVCGDFNRWQPERRYDAIIANQSLHHVLNLEGLFAAIREALAPHGVFLTSDMIGRNGHQRWPEALAIVREFWRELPQEYRFNHQLQRQEDEFLDWDCSTEGFEGIRAQDVLPLLLKHFEFDLFIGFGNIIAPFVDRSFGHHFRVENESARAFIDRVHARDEAEMLTGHLKPTQMIAAMCVDRPGKRQYWKNLSPEFCVRVPD